MPTLDCSTNETDLPPCDLYRGEDLSGSLAGPYRLISRIGMRGAADIYLGKTSQSSGAPVILKVVDTLSTPASAVRLFNQERQLIGRFEHPQIAKMLDEGTTTTGALYLAMEFVDGLPVDEFVTKWSVSGNALINLLLQICSAVEYLHSVGFALNDFQENILVRRGPHAVITDLGGAVALPGDPHDRRFARSLDVHSLGVLIRDSTTCSGWPELSQVVRKATQPAPADRFPTVSDFAQRLQRLL